LSLAQPPAAAEQATRTDSKERLSRGSVMPLRDDMGEKKKKQIPKWPDSLPPFTELTILPPEHVFYRHQLIADSDIRDLIHDLYYFPDDKYFLYYECESKNIPKGFDAKKLERCGLSLRKHESFFYRRPYEDDRPDKYSYIRLTAADIHYPWQQEIIDNGPMYGRVQIELFEWKKKEIELYRIKSLNSKKDGPLILQPNFMGLGIDLKKIPSWLKRFFSKRA